MNSIRGIAGIRSMFAGIAHRYDLANDILSFGIHRIWKRALVRIPAEKHFTRALDLCTGTGDLLPLLRNYSDHVTGIDFCLPMLVEGKRRGRGFDADMILSDALALPFPPDSFDLVTVAYGVRNIPELERGLGEMWRVLKPGGRLLVLEFGQPGGYLFSRLYRFYSQWFLPYIGGLLSGDVKAFRYLCDTCAAFPCGERFAAILRSSGFEVDLVKTQSFGISYAYSARKKDLSLDKSNLLH